MWGELPPRARRILFSQIVASEIPGTTSACAENTGVMLSRIFGWWNYLRVRGEYQWAYARAKSSSELPPRARRIHTLTTLPRHGRGTTSACAENTHALRRGGDRPRNYLRVRGEYFPQRLLGTVPLELPPRARRIQPKCRIRPVAHGTTSACAENTENPICRSMRPGNYLRVRGEYATA